MCCCGLCDVICDMMCAPRCVASPAPMQPPVHGRNDRGQLRKQDTDTPHHAHAATSNAEQANAFAAVKATTCSVVGASACAAWRPVFSALTCGAQYAIRWVEDFRRCSSVSFSFMFTVRHSREQFRRFLLLYVRNLLC